MNKEVKSAGRAGPLKIAARSKLRLLTVLSCAAVAAGCIVAPEGIPVITGLEQDDIPVPQQFTFQESTSPDYQTPPMGRFRSWRAVYHGGGRLDDLVPWYLEEMDEFGWTFTRLEEDLRGRKALHFKKDGEYAIIHVYREIVARSGSYTNVVKAEIHPFGPEDYTVEGNMEKLKKSLARPASYSVDPASDPPPSEASGQDNNRSRVEAEVRPEPAARREQILEEIDRFEHP